MIILLSFSRANKRFIAVYGFCIKICDSKSDKFQNMFMRVRQYKRFVAYIFDKLFCYESIKQRFNEDKPCSEYTRAGNCSEISDC